MARACQVSRVGAVQRAASLQSTARISGVAALRNQQQGAVAAASRLSVVRAMSAATTPNGPVTKKVCVCICLCGVTERFEVCTDLVS